MSHLEDLQKIAAIPPERDFNGYASCAKILVARIEKGELTPEAALSLLFILEGDNE